MVAISFTIASLIPLLVRLAQQRNRFVADPRGLLKLSGVRGGGDMVELPHPSLLGIPNGIHKAMPNPE